MGQKPQNNNSWSDRELEDVLCCPVCGGKDRQVLHYGLTDRIFYCAPGDWTLNQCLHCRSAYLDPRPTEDSILQAYDLYYTHSAPIERGYQSGGHTVRFRKSLLNGYLNYRFGTNFGPSNRLGILCAFFYPGLRNKLERRYRNLPKFKAGSSVLDVGFGAGMFLAYAKSFGWKVVGADPDPVTVKAARQKGFEVRQGGIESFDDMENCFDVVTLNHVIEHVHNPRLLLEKAFRLLKPGGSIWLETPNIDSLGYRLFRRHWRGLEPPRHLALFNWESLETLLADAGFSSIRRFPCTDAFAGFAAKSRAIGAGCDPYQAKITFPDRALGLIARCLTHVNRCYSEHVTVSAVKPELTNNV